MGVGISKDPQNETNNIPIKSEILNDQACQISIGIVIGFMLAMLFYKDNFTISRGDRMTRTEKKDTMCGGGIGDRIPPYYAMSRTALRRSCKSCDNEKVKDYTKYAVPYNDNRSETFVSDGTYDEEYMPPPGAVDVNMYRGEMGYGRNYGPPVLP